MPCSVCKFKSQAAAKYWTQNVPYGTLQFGLKYGKVGNQTPGELDTPPSAQSFSLHSGGMLFTAGNIRFNLIQIHRSLDLNGKHYSPLCGTVKDSRTTSALNCIKSSQSAAVCVSPRLVCDWQVSRAFLLHNACFHKDKDLRYKYTHMCSMVCNRTSQHTSNVSTE